MINPDQYLCLSVEKATTPVAGQAHCIVDAWWSVVPDQGILLFRALPHARGICSPQFNSDRRVTERITAKLYPFAEVQQLHTVFLRLTNYGYTVPPDAVPYRPEEKTNGRTDQAER